MLKYKSMVYCENCKRYSYLESYLKDNFISFKLTDTKECSNNHGDFEILSSSLSSTLVQYKCKSCESYSVVTIDAPIAEIVLAFNELGFNTAFSCAGHNPHENSYISFVSKLSDKPVEPLSHQQRLLLHEYFNQLIIRDDFIRIKNMTSLEYKSYDYSKGEFISKDLSDDEGNLSIDFIYVSDENIDSTNIDLDDYVECRRIFLKLLKAIVCILQFVDVINKITF